MRTIAFVVGMFGGFAGIYFALLLVIATGLFGAIASISGSWSAAQPLYWGLAALGSYTLGVIGGALAIHRPGTAALVMFVAAVGGALTTVMVGPAAISALGPSSSGATSIFATPQPRASFFSTLNTSDPSAYLYLLVAFGGAALLLLAAFFAAIVRPASADETVPVRAVG